jgi:uncharacterized membrane protein YheB (UPF0754 family)
MYKNWRIDSQFYMRFLKNKTEKMTTCKKLFLCAVSSIQNKIDEDLINLNINELKWRVLELYKQEWNIKKIGQTQCLDTSSKNKRVPRETKVNNLWKCHEVHYDIVTDTVCTTQMLETAITKMKIDREEKWSLVM